MGHPPPSPSAERLCPSRGRRLGHALLLAGLALGFPRTPLSAQVDERYDFGATIGHRVTNVLINTVANTVIAGIGGEHPGRSFVKSALVSLVDEAVIGLDAHLAVEQGTETPLSIFGGTAVNSMRANIQQGRPLCRDLRATYLVVDVIFDCGDLDLGVNATPLLGALYFQFAGDDFDLGRTVRLGVPTFRLDDDVRSGTIVLEQSENTIFDRRVTGLAIGGAIGFQSKTTSGTVLDSGSGSPAPVSAERSPERIATTVLHEVRHVLQYDLLDKSMERVDGPWYIHSRLGTDRARLDITPVGSASIGLLLGIFGHDFALWEATADTEIEGWR